MAIIIHLSLLAGPYKTNAFYGQGTGKIAIENTACSGSESQLLACSSSPIFGTTCSHSEDAGVDCEGILFLYSSITINFKKA